MDFQNNTNAEVSQSDSLRKRPKRHRKESKRILAIITASLLMLIIWGICALAGSLMKVRKIEVIGESPYNKDEIIAVAAIKNGDKVNRIDKDSVEKSILQKLSYISEVRVKSGFFGKIKISVISDKAAYYTLISGEYFAMSDDFRLLGKESNTSGYESGKLIYISLPKIKSAILGDYLSYYDAESIFLPQLLKDIDQSGMLDSVSAIEAQSKYEIEITYEKFTIVIGAYKDIAAKLTLASQMAKDDILSTAESAILDVSDPANATIRFQ